MNIFVLLKQTFDTEEHVRIESGVIADDDVKFVINPYDEYAVEEAVQIKDDLGGKVTIVSIGPDRSEEALRTALAMGADEAVLIDPEDYQLDEHSYSKILHAYLKDQSVDLIIGGFFSVDQGSGQVAIRLAHLLDIPHVSAITELNVEEGKATAKRDAEGDTETVQVALPALFTAQQGLNEPRYPSLPGIMKAKKKPLQRLMLDELGIDEISGKTVSTEITSPPSRKAGEILQGEVEEQVEQLIAKLKEDKVLNT
ncbi:electron transfer flavoprotein subunit beta/FixA family protein [Longirhabdus pacifica]|uniref:electron transfer flavoprotein subunit beta/FixA family protein n=1 Tax=Longirhabdus pacifica TaxID=2305227 RepID=UPI0010091911|nr:electron transfer flavoprotein subunit beta/FixA family protein [Longirhabdus pacifica]